jgi:hypothetical protein
MFQYFYNFMNKYVWNTNVPITLDEDVVPNLVDSEVGYIYVGDMSETTDADAEHALFSFYQKCPISIELAEFMHLVPENCTASIADAIRSIQQYLKNNALPWSKRLFIPDLVIMELLDIPLSTTEMRWADVPKKLLRHFRIYSMVVTTLPTKTYYTFIPRRLFTENLVARALTENSFPFVSDDFPNGIEAGNNGVFGYSVEFESNPHFQFPENIMVDRVYTYYM